MSEQLKPCPFCGGEASNMHAYGLHERVYCRKCFASTSTSFTDRGKAFAAWNARTDLSQALVAAKLHEAATALEVYWPHKTTPEMRDSILALIDTDHQAALDAVRAEERERCKPKVKPLEWASGSGRWNAGDYVIKDISYGQREVRRLLRAAFGTTYLADFSGKNPLEAAKAAAQADYERRILSALEAGHE